jgi:PPOX class probable F420-dependent enzyme
MATTIPDKFQDLFKDDSKAIANLATLMSDGSPQVTPVWFDFSDGKIRVNSAKGRVKDKNMKREARVALAISDPANPYRHIQLRGRVVDITEDGASEHLDKLAKKYIDQDKYPWHQPGDVRVMYLIEPASFSVMG